MYFAVLPQYLVQENGKYIVFNNNVEKIKKFLKKFSEIEEITDENTAYVYYGLSKKSLRKLKILSLTDENLKEELIKLEELLNDKDKINIYGEKKPMLYSSSSSTGTSGTSGIIGPNTTSFKNRFIGRPSKKIDFHKINKKYNIYK